jgi:hypothetical protein
VNGFKTTSPFNLRQRFFKKSDNGGRSKISYVTSVNVTVDGKKLDLIETPMTEFDATVNYFRFCRYLGADSFFSTGISLADYRKSYAMFIYLLAVTHNEVFGMINGVKTGTVRMEERDSP